MKQFFYQYRHALAFLYLPFYLLCFFYLENRNTKNYHVIKLNLDDLIPFNEWFIIPYLLWFGYIAVTVLYFFFTNKRDFFRLCLFLFTGMTICLIIYYFWPNGHHLRQDLTKLGRENIFTQMVAHLYSVDTSTNVCPSIHTLNSIGACIAIFHSNALKNKHWIRSSALLLTIAICLSTVFLKQHSIFDVFCAIALSLVMYRISYGPRFERISEQVKKPRLIASESSHH